MAVNCNETGLLVFSSHHFTDDVFEFFAERKFTPLDLLTNFVEMRDDLFAFLIGNQADFGEHLRMRL